MTLFGPDGLPLRDVPPGPSEGLEQRVNDELQRLDTLLHIRWIEKAYFNQRHQRFEGRYALCCWWPKVDKRWQWVQQSKMSADEAFDIMGWFCEDIHNAESVPQKPLAMMDKVYELLSSADNTHRPWADRMAEITAANARHRRQMIDNITELAGKAAAEMHGIKSMRHGKKTSDPLRLDWGGLDVEVEQELQKLNPTGGKE